MQLLANVADRSIPEMLTLQHHNQNKKPMDIHFILRLLNNTPLAVATRIDRSATLSHRTP